MCLLFARLSTCTACRCRPGVDIAFVVSWTWFTTKRDTFLTLVPKRDLICCSFWYYSMCELKQIAHNSETTFFASLCIYHAQYSSLNRRMQRAQKSLKLRCNGGLPFTFVLSIHITNAVMVNPYQKVLRLTITGLTGQWVKPRLVVQIEATRFVRQVLKDKDSKSDL